MKRPHDPKGRARQTVTGDIRKDLSDKQLAHLGAAAIAYNNVEAYIDLLFFNVVRIEGALQYEVSTRINGIDGKIAIIKKGAALSGWDADLQRQLEEALGNGVFGRLKSFRDSAIHARIIEGAIGIGVRIDRQAKMFEVLLSETALETLYKHLVELALELNYLNHALGMRRAYFGLPAGDARKSSGSAAIARWTERARARRPVRLNLPKIPDFPTDEELREAEARWLKAGADALSVDDPINRCL